VTFRTVTGLLDEILGLGGLPFALPDQVTIRNSDPVLPFPYPFGTAGAATLAAVGLASQRLWAIRSIRTQQVSVDVRAAAASLRGVLYMSLDGDYPAGKHRDPVAGFYRVKDGRWIYLHCYFPSHREHALKVLGAASRDEAVRNAKRWDGTDLEDAIHAAGGCAGFVRTAEEWERHSQVRALQSEELLSVERIGEAPPQVLPSHDRPLAGCRVLDVTRVLAGPTCTRTLAEHGAEVLRVTAAHLPELGPLEFDAGAGKLSTYVDLRAETGRDILRGIARDADVFVQSYRPGAMAALGFGAADVAKLRPGIVYAEITAWGYTGPWQGRRGYDSVVQTANGMVARCSPAEKPAMVHAMPMDYLSGYLMAYGVMVALARRAESGGSWRVRVSLAKVGQWLLGMGEVPDDQWRAVPADLPSDEIDAMSTGFDTPLGPLRMLRPAVSLSDTMPFLARPPVPLGTHRPAWP
jgi:crotonobetainyl-CoA:carnitine CoA-transferase CaiB-like acyl-CoA transferase